MQFPKRYLTDGTATTLRVVALEPTDKPRVYRVLTAWAGDTIPEDRGWRVAVSVGGACALKGIPERETPQLRAGIIRRAKALAAQQSA